MEFNRIAIHNRGVFDIVYKDLMLGKYPEPNFAGLHKKIDRKLAKLLADLRGVGDKLEQIVPGNQKRPVCEHHNRHHHLVEEEEEAPIPEAVSPVQSKQTNEFELYSGQHADEKRKLKFGPDAQKAKDNRAEKEKIRLMKRAEMGLPVFDKYMTEMSSYCETTREMEDSEMARLTTPVDEETDQDDDKSTTEEK